MKIRNGFVSNSSSSSFVIAVPKDMEMTAENLHKQLWGDKELTFGPEYDWHSVRVNTMELSKEIVERVTKEVDEFECRSGCVSDKLNDVIEPDYDYWSMINRFKTINENGKEVYDWDAYNTEVAKLTDVAVEEFLHGYPNHDFYRVEYSDDSEYGCEVEHGQAMRIAKGVTRFSHH